MLHVCSNESVDDSAFFSSCAGFLIFALYGNPYLTSYFSALKVSSFEQYQKSFPLACASSFQATTLDVCVFIALDDLALWAGDLRGKHARAMQVEPGVERLLVERVDPVLSAENKA